MVNELEMLDMPWFNVKKGKTGDKEIWEEENGKTPLNWGTV